MDEIVKVDEGQITIAQDVMDKYLILKDAEKQFKALEKELKDALVKCMVENDIKRVVTDSFSVTLKYGGYRKSLDTKKIEEAFEEFGIDIREYQKETPFSASVIIKALDEQVDYE